MNASRLVMSTRRRWAWLLCSTALASGVLLATPRCAVANPSGGQVVGGNATISHGPGTTTIDQTSNKAIINWQEFSIGSGETTRFNQPGSDAIALNRDRGGQRSDLFGRLEANGHVWLVNPNGVLIGPGAKIDVGGFLATTADIPDADFLAGRFSFSVPSPFPEAEVANQGTISVRDSGLAALVAPHVRNDGVIEGRYGTMVVAGTPTFALDFYGDGLINFDVTSAVTEVADPGQALAQNAGIIRAEGGRVLITAEAAAEVVDTVIDVSGVIEARSFAQRGGEIVLEGGDHGIVAVAGTLDASGRAVGETGGEVAVLGEMVALYSGTQIDVAGDLGGGEALIGGNYQGKGPEKNAKRTYVDPGASITADAVTAGDGGQVIVWSDEVTGYYGQISARGGAAGGNGGFVEVSGKQSLAFEGQVDVSAAQGISGTVLLDPENIIIDTTGSNDGDVLDAVVFFGDGPGLTYTISDTALEALTGDIRLQTTNDITVDATVNLTNQGFGETFSLQAGRNININAAITTAGGNVHLEADSPYSGALNGDGAINLNAPLTTNGGSVTAILAGLNVGANGLVQTGSGAINATLSANGAPLTVLDMLINPIVSDGTFTIGQATTRGSSGDGVGAETLTVGSLTLALSGPVASTVAGNLSLIALNDITITQPLILAEQGLDETFSLQAGRDITINAAITTQGGNVHLEADSIHSPIGYGGNGDGNVTVSAPISTNNGSVTFLFGFFSELDIRSVVDAGSGNINIAPSGPPAPDGYYFYIDETIAASLVNLRSTGTLTLGQAITRGPSGNGQAGQLTRAGDFYLGNSLTIPGETARQVVIVSEQDIEFDGDLRVNQPLTVIADADGLPNFSSPDSDHWGWIINPGYTLYLNGDVSLSAFEGIYLTTNNLQRVAAVVTGRSSYMPGNIWITNTGSNINITTIGDVSGVRSVNSQVFISNQEGFITIDAPIVAQAPDQDQFFTSDFQPFGNSQSSPSSIILDAAAFINNVGPTGLQPGSGRFLVYSVDPAVDQTGGLDGQQRFDSTFAAVPPDSAVLTAGTNFLLYEVGAPSGDGGGGGADGTPGVSRRDIPPSVFNPVLSLADVGTRTLAEASGQDDPIAVAPAQQQLLPQVSRGPEDTEEDILYSNDGRYSNDLGDIPSFPAAAAGS